MLILLEGLVFNIMIIEFNSMGVLYYTRRGIYWKLDISRVTDGN